MGRRARGAPCRASLVALACALVLLALTAVSAPTQAAFSASTATPVNTLSADQLAPPSNLSATQTCAMPPLIAFRAATTDVGTDSLTLDIPAGTAAGDVLLAQVSNVYTTAVLTAPGGWTLVRRDTSATAVTSAVYQKPAVAGESSVTFSYPPGTDVGMAGGLAAYSGVSTTAPVDVSAGQVGLGTTAITPAVTTTTANTVLVRLITNAYESYPAPAGTTQRWRFGETGSGGVTAADEPFVGPGTAPSRSSASPSGMSAYGIGQTVALRRAPRTAWAALSWSASPSTWATGYRLERSAGGTLQATAIVSPVGTTTTTDGPLVNGTTYTFVLQTQRGTWTSAPVSTTLTPSC